MYGEPIQALNNALSGMVASLRLDPHAAETVWISVTTFGLEVETLMPLTELAQINIPSITCPQSGPTFTGKGLAELKRNVERDMRRSTPDQKGDWRPLLFIFTDGKPSDIAFYDELVPEIRALQFATIVGCAAGDLADESKLAELADTLVHLETADTATLQQFFKWVSEAIEGGELASSQAIDLPPPPSEVNIII